MFKHLAATLPDLPRWVEVRSMLLCGRGEVYGWEETGAGNFVIRDPEAKLIAVLGRPARTAIQAAAARQSQQGALITALENRSYVAAALPAWGAETATLHLLKDETRVATARRDAVRLLTLAEVESLGHVPTLLKEELVTAARWSPIATVCADQLPVSFCYAGAQTESLWDISIDTLPEYRRRGYVASCVAFLIERFRAQGLQPVWGAVASNVASMRLAAKLGFVPVDQIVVFEPKEF